MGTDSIDFSPFLLPSPKKKNIMKKVFGQQNPKKIASIGYLVDYQIEIDCQNDFQSVVKKIID